MSLEKKKPSKKSVKEIYFALQYLIALNTKIFLNSFHDQIFLRNTVFSVLISGVKILLIGLRNAVIDSYIFSTLYKRFYFSLPLNPAIHRMGITPYILWPICKEQKSFKPIWYFIAGSSLSKLFKNIHDGNFFPIQWWCTVKHLRTFSLEIYYWTGLKRNLCTSLELTFKQ